MILAIGGFAGRAGGAGARRSGRDRGHRRAGPAGPLSGRLIVFAHRVEPGAAPRGCDRHLPLRAHRHRGRGARGRSAARPARSRPSTARPTPSRRPSRRCRPAPTASRRCSTATTITIMAAAAQGDLVSPVVEAHLPGSAARPGPDRDSSGARSRRDVRRAARGRARGDPRRPGTQAVAVDFVSPNLSAFWGRPIHMRGWIALPPGYRAGRADLPGRLLDPRLRRHLRLRPGSTAAQRGPAHGGGRLAADDLGLPRRKLADRHPRIRRFGQ